MQTVSSIWRSDYYTFQFISHSTTLDVRIYFRGLLNVSIDLVVICLTSAERTYTVAFCWANEHDA